MSTHVYDLTDFPNTKAAGAKLSAEIEAACGQVPLSVDVGASQVIIEFSPDLPAEQEANLDAAVAAHDGVRAIVEFIAASEAVNTEKAITQDQTWEVLGGVVTNPLFFIHDPNQVVARVVGQLKTVGVGMEMRLVENSGEKVLTSAVFQAPDSADAWQEFKFQTDVPPDSQTETLYRLEGRLNGATSASIRFTAMTLLRVELQ